MALRWGICSTGRICSDFCSAVKTLPEDEHTVRYENKVVLLD